LCLQRGKLQLVVRQAAKVVPQGPAVVDQPGIMAARASPRACVSGSGFVARAVSIAPRPA